MNQQGQVLAIVRAFNKLKLPLVPNVALSEQLDHNGFIQTDADKLKQRTKSLLPILLAFQSFHREIRTIQEQRKAMNPLYQAISFVSQSSGHPDELLQKVMQAAKKLTNADRAPCGLSIIKVMSCGRKFLSLMVLS